MAWARRERAALVFLALASALAPRPASARPEWAKPYLDLPTPDGPYIARNDDWVVVFAEVEFALTAAGTIESRNHLLLENRSDRPETFSTALSYDEGAHELKDLALFVQRTLWHQIDLKRTASTLSIRGSTQVVYASIENLDPHKRVVLEYTLTDRVGFLPWMQVTVPRSEPIARIRYRVDEASAHRGLLLRLHVPEGTPQPGGFTQEPGGSWMVEAVPAWDRILTRKLLFQPESDSLFPSIVAVIADRPEDTPAGFVRRYRAEWAQRVAAIDPRVIGARAAALTGDGADAFDRTARLAAFVQNDIRYDDSNENSLEAWLPLAPGEVLRSMKADCKGKVMLLQALLKAVGIESTPVLLHAGHDFSAPSSHVSTSFINHVILAVALPAEAESGAVQTDGAAAGLVLFDPTWRGSAFGQPLPGYEGVPALFVGETDHPEFVIHTAARSLATSVIHLDMRVDETGRARIRVGAEDNGGSSIFRQLSGGGTDIEHRDVVAQALDDLLPRLQVFGATATPPSIHPPSSAHVALEVVSPQCLQELAQTSLVTNPLGLAARLAGLPTQIRPAPPPRPDDAAVLSSPWDLKGNAFGTHTLIEATVRLELPPTLAWSPPPPRSEDHPWVHFRVEWSELEGRAFQGTLRLELPRGEWAPEDRRKRLALMDEIFTSLSSPLIATPVPVGPRPR